MLFTENDKRPPKSEKIEKLWDRSVDRKERLVQTYTVIYGLLISFGQNESFRVQSDVVSLFFPFLIAILVYDTLLSRITYDGMFDDSPWYFLSIFVMDFCAMIASYNFSYAVISYMMVFGSDDYLLGFRTMILLLFLVVLSSLSASLYSGYVWLRDWLWLKSSH